MSIESTEKVPENHPQRCQNTNAAGNPCLNKALEGCTYCSACGGARQRVVQEQKSIRTYRLAKFQARLNEFATDPNIKGLRDEIGILRIMLEERLNSLSTPLEILSHTHTISDLASKIEKLVTSCHKLEKSMGEYLDKNTIVQLGMEIVQIITRHVDDPKAIDNIAGELSTLISRTINESEE